jgi:hypothetical protein
MEVLSPYCGLLPLSQNDCPTSSIFVVPKWLSGLSAWLKIWDSKSNIFAPNFHHQEDFQHHHCRAHFGVVVFFYFESHTYNCSVNDRRALISPNIMTRTIILGRREYLLHRLVERIDPQLATVIRQSWCSSKSVPISFLHHYYEWQKWCYFILKCLILLIAFTND